MYCKCIAFRACFSISLGPDHRHLLQKALGVRLFQCFVCMHSTAGLSAPSVHMCVRACVYVCVYMCVHMCVCVVHVNMCMCIHVCESESDVVSPLQVTPLTIGELTLYPRAVSTCMSVHPPRRTVSNGWLPLVRPSRRSQRHPSCRKWNWTMWNSM